jgi:hypothetical protein
MSDCQIALKRKPWPLPSLIVVAYWPQEATGPGTSYPNLLAEKYFAAADGVAPKKTTSSPAIKPRAAARFQSR